MTDSPAPQSIPPRYARQVCYPPIGATGQQKLLAARIAIVGCGALGSATADTLVRAGVGYVRLIDRDFIELDNLQRQTLYDEDDLAANLPKAEAAAQKLRRINSDVTIEPRVADVNASTAPELLQNVDLLVDGGDNFELRYLVNDYAVMHGRPWIYGAALGAEGRVLPIVSRETPCLRCVFPDPPPPGSTPTCETAGVLAAAVNLTASLQATAAIKLLIGDRAAVDWRLVHFDLWRNTFRQLDVSASGPGGDCPACGQGRFDYLSGGQAALSTSLCGRNAVQVLPAAGAQLDFETVATALRNSASDELIVNRFLIRCTLDGFQITLFRDGRAIIQGTADLAKARNLYAKYVGS